MEDKCEMTEADIHNLTSTLKGLCEDVQEIKDYVVGCPDTMGLVTRVDRLENAERMRSHREERWGSHILQIITAAVIGAGAAIASMLGFNPQNKP